jgi:3-hydroxybutyryl-CoA dehydratase
MTSTYEALSARTPGETATYTRQVTDADVALFALITGDQHPLHLNQHYAAGTRFAQRIIPTTLIAGIVEAALATTIPGMCGVVQRQQLEFPALAYVDDAITVTITVLGVEATQAHMCCGINASNQNGETVARGEMRLAIEDLPAVGEDDDA